MEEVQGKRNHGAISEHLEQSEVNRKPPPFFLASLTMLLIPPPTILGIQAVKRMQVGEKVVVGLVLDCCDSAAMLLLQMGMLILKKASEQEVGRCWLAGEPSTFLPFPEGGSQNLTAGVEKLEHAYFSIRPICKCRYIAAATWSIWSNWSIWSLI